MLKYSSLTKDQISILRKLPERYLILSPQLDIITATDAYLDATRLSEGQVRDRHLKEVFPQDKSSYAADLQTSLSALLEGVSEKTVATGHYELTGHTAQHDEGIWQLENVPVVNAAGELWYIIHKILWLPNMSATSADKMEDLQMLQSLIDQAPVAMCMFLGEELTIASANQLICEMWGYPAKEVLNKPLTEAVPELKGQGFDDLIRKVLHTGEPYIGTEMEAKLLRNEKEETTYYNFVYQPVYDKRGKILGVVDVAIEVTELVRSRRLVEDREKKLRQMNASLEKHVQERTQELQQKNDELAEVNRRLSYVNSDMDSFIYTASHDLKNPITNIQGLVQLLQRKLPADEESNYPAQKLLGMMQLSIERFMKTIGDLSEIVRVQKIEKQPAELIRLTDVIKEVCLDINPTIQEANAQIQIEDEVCRPINFAPKNARSVIYNLLSNAVKYRDPDRTPVIQVSCREEQGYQCLVVSDNGLGMDLSGGKRLFSMFTRLHDHVEGTGIGLYNVKKILDNSGGKIRVKSTPGEGTTFKVYFKDMENVQG